MKHAIIGNEWFDFPVYCPPGTFPEANRRRTGLSLAPLGKIHNWLWRWHVVWPCAHHYGLGDAKDPLCLRRFRYANSSGSSIIEDQVKLGDSSRIAERKGGAYWYQVAVLIVIEKLDGGPGEVVGTARI